MQNRRWWDAAALAVASVTVLFTLISPPYGIGEWGSWATAGAFLALYFAFARRYVGREEVGPHIAISITLAIVLAVGTSFEPSFATLQAFIYPFIWATAPSLRNAIVANALVAVAIVVGYTVRSGLPGFGPGLGVAALSFAFSLALGLWITRIAQYGEERGRLLDQLQSAQGQLAAMHRDAGVTDERARLAREIHDTIAQSLTGLVMVAQRAGNRLEPVGGEAAASARRDLELIEQMAREALTEARGLVASLTPVEASAGLGDALRRLASSFERETGVAVTVETDAAGLDRELEVVLLRSAQEALANVRKHARAGTASISVVASGADVVLTVTDDGVGPGDAASAERLGEQGFGLAGIRDRAAMAGGRFEFGPGEGGGSRLQVVVPRTDAAGSTDAANGAGAAASDARNRTQGGTA